jgi:uncharacterized protein DUF4242
MPSQRDCRGHVVECYWPSVTQGQLIAASHRAHGAAADLRRKGVEITYLGSILMPADETVFCLFDGDANDVRAVCQEAGLPFERVMEAQWLGSTRWGDASW